MAGKKEIPRELSIYINDVQVINSLNGITRAINSTNNEIKNLNKNSATYDADLKRLQTTLGGLKEKQVEFKEEIATTQTSLQKLKEKLGAVGSSILTAFSVTAIFSGFVSALKGAYQTIKEFDQAIADLSAITGATGKNLNYLKDNAIELGSKTKGGAIAVVEAYKLIASAKPELLDNVNALNQVTEATITLANAAGMELPDAATALTDAMNQFGADASQANMFIDALANGAKYGAAEIPDVTDALLKFGAVARSSNVDIKESTALVELLAENGLKGADAGTALRNVMLKISAPDALPLDAQKSLHDLGISFTTLKDKSISFQEKIELLKPLLKDNAKLVNVFGLENVVAARNVIEHTDRLKELSSKMGEVGTAQSQAATRMDTLQGKTIELSSTYDSLVLSVGKGSGIISSSFKSMVESATGLLMIFKRINTSWDELYAQASQKGGKDGEDTFTRLMGDKKGKEAAEEAQSNINIARNALKTLDDQISSTQEKIKKEGGFIKSSFFSMGAISEVDGTRKSKSGLQQDLEILKQSQAEYAKLLKLSKEYINNQNKPQLNTPVEKQEAYIDPEIEKKRKKELAEAEKQRQLLEDKAIALANAKANLAKSELDNFIANNRTKINSETILNETIVSEEKERIDSIKFIRENALAEKRLSDVEEAKKSSKDKKDLIIALKAIDVEYQTSVLMLNAETEKEKNDLDKKYLDQQNQNKIEQIKAQNDLEILYAKTKYDKEAILRKQAYNQEVKDLDEKLKKEKITKEQYEKYIIALDKKTKDQERTSELNKTNETLNGLNKVAGAIGLMFGQSKSLALSQAAINGAMAVTSILAEYPKFDGGISMWASIAAAGSTTLEEIAKITSTKAPQTPKFFYGGPTGTMPNFGNDEFGPITGVVHSNEWVAPAVMTENPRYAATFSWLEKERQGIVGKKYFSGGETSPGTISVFQNENKTNEKLLAAINKLNEHLDIGIKASTNIGYDDVKKINDLNNERLTSISYGTVNK
jgi:TP901 family phage tail tape measure protein